MIAFKILQIHRERKGYPPCSFLRFPHPKTFSSCQECAWLEPASSGNVPLFLLEPHPQQGSHRGPTSIQKLENLPRSLSLPYDPTPSQFKFGLLTENWIFWTLKKTCSVSPHGISSVKGNRLAFVTLSVVEDYGRSPKLGVGLMAGGKVWSVDLA